MYNRKFASVTKDQKFVPTHGGQRVPVGKVVFKSCQGDVAKLLVVEEGLVPNNSVGRGGDYDGKFRVRKVFVLGIVDREGSVLFDASSGRGGIYVVGQLYTPNGFTSDVDDDCGMGVHCFATYGQAKRLSV